MKKKIKRTTKKKQKKSTSGKNKTKRTTKRKKVVGLLERVKVIGSKGSIKTIALFDTGATRSSIDLKIAAKIGLGPIVGTVNLRSKTSKTGLIQRPIVKAKIRILGKTFNEKVNLTDRKSMLCPVLIGRTIIHNNFIVDLSKTHRGYKIKDLKKKIKHKKSSKKAKARKTKARRKKK